MSKVQHKPEEVVPVITMAMAALRERMPNATDVHRARFLVALAEANLEAAILVAEQHKQVQDNQR